LKKDNFAARHFILDKKKSFFTAKKKLCFFEKKYFHLKKNPLPQKNLFLKENVFFSKKQSIFAIRNFNIFCNKNFLLQKMLKFLIAKMVDFRVALPCCTTCPILVLQESSILLLH